MRKVMSAKINLLLGNFRLKTKSSYGSDLWGHHSYLPKCYFLPIQC